MFKLTNNDKSFIDIGKYTVVNKWQIISDIKKIIN